MASERHFRADYISPANVTNRVGLSDTFPLWGERHELDMPTPREQGDDQPKQPAPQSTGTCTEYRFDLVDTDPAAYFASAGFLPTGALDAARPFNVAEPLTLGSGRRVMLRFNVRARTNPRNRVANVRFTTGGFSYRDLADGIRFPQEPRTTPLPVRDRWRAVEIDLSRRAGGLDRVVNPLQVIVKTEENANIEEVFVYLKDIRYEVVEPTDSDQ